MNHKTIRRTLALCGGAILTLATIGVGLSQHKEHDHDKKVETKSFVGHVVGLACYFGHGSIGDSHLDCATTCATAATRVTPPASPCLLRRLTARWCRISGMLRATTSLRSLWRPAFWRRLESF